MSFSRPPSRINPKISTMPRQQSESAHYLDVYKLTIEKKRLKQELESLEKRRDRIEERLNVIEDQIQDLEYEAHRYREPSQTSRSFASEPNSVIYPPAYGYDRTEKEDFKTVTLDY
jgi:predicted  nucleic acid-binding Zn-ribbon protein